MIHEINTAGMLKDYGNTVLYIKLTMVPSMVTCATASV